jgi:hypothetical protein
MRPNLAQWHAPEEQRSSAEDRQQRQSRQSPGQSKPERPARTRQSPEQPAAHLTQKPGAHGREYDRAQHGAAVDIQSTAVKHRPKASETAQEITQLTRSQGNRHDESDAAHTHL